MLSLLGATGCWQRNSWSRLAQACQEFLRCVSPNLGPVRIPTRRGDHLCSLERARPAAASRNPLSLPRCPDMLVLCWACSRYTWEWLFGLGLSLFNHVAREIPKEPVPQAWPPLCRPHMWGGRERYLLGNRLVTEGVFI